MSFSLFVFEAGTSFADVSTIYLFSDARDLFEKADHNTLIIFDVDSCLVHPLDLCLWGENNNAEVSESAWKDLVQRYKNLQNPVLVARKKSQIMQNAEVGVFETTLRKMIYKNKAEKLGGRFMATSPLKAGSYGEIAEIGEWLYDHLNRFGYDFIAFFDESLSPSFDKKIFKEPLPTFYKGILLRGGHPIDLVLEQFLDQTLEAGQKVILFLNDHATLIKLDQKFQYKPYQFRGIHYQKYDPNPFNFQCEREIIDYQLDFLMLHNQWLEESRVRSLLNFGF
ncbi:MAG: DUF2608 domain-containing protein [Alphaproteobacteria bacterium]|nr:DUF2608 domain-containing protein [Alphaproteobacteria bacterium]